VREAGRIRTPQKDVIATQQFVLLTLASSNETPVPEKRIRDV
jgi:hypothetical protein